MSQRTLVVVLPPARGAELQARLEHASFDFRSAPHTRFVARGEGVIASLYTSGKLVVQGVQPELFLERWLGIAPEPERAAPTPQGLDVATIGSDECGKGDYFGPLVVAAVRLEPEEKAKLLHGEVRDSKTLGDEQCLRIAAALRQHVAHKVVRLDPERYNQIYRAGKLNDLLGDLHAEAIGALVRPGIRVVVDQFADARLMRGKLQALDVQLEQRTQAESHELAVAAASILARAEFLLALDELSHANDIALHKGAGPPVDRVARRLVDAQGRAALARVAKLHFKNTLKLPAGSP